MEENYKKLLARMSKISGVGEDDLDRQVEAKRAKLSGLISKEGAAQVIAAELGIKFDNGKLKIEELIPGMRNVNITGKIINLFPIREYTNKSGEPSKVANFILADDTSNIKVVLWDTNHIALIEKGEIGEGKSVEIISGGVRDGEIHLGSFSEFKLSDEVFKTVQTKKVTSEKSILDFKIGDSAQVRAFIVQAFSPKFFQINPETGRKPTPEEIESNVKTEKRALINVVLDDGTMSIRTVLFHERLISLGIEDLENEEVLANQVQNILGKEMVFAGNVRNNNYFNTPEFVIDGVEAVNYDELITALEDK